jgi:hypothetical protein
MVYARGSAGAEDVAAGAGRDPAEMAGILETLLHRRLLRHDGTVYAPLGPVQ